MIVPKERLACPVAGRGGVSQSCRGCHGFSDTFVKALVTLLTVCLGESNVGGVEVGEGRIFPARRGSCGLAEKSAAGDHGCPDPYAVIGAVGSMGSFQVTG